MSNQYKLIFIYKSIKLLHAGLCTNSPSSPAMTSNPSSLFLWVSSLSSCKGLSPNLALNLLVSSTERLSEDDDMDGGGGGVRLGGGGVRTSCRDILGGGGTKITSSSKI